MSCCKQEALTEEQKGKIGEIIDGLIDKEGSLIEVLHHVQDYYGYLPFIVQKEISERMNIPLPDIYGVVTFYSRFSLEPVGKYKISVCLGTACYVKGAQNIYDALKEKLDLKDKNITDDRKFSLDSARCVGACGLAPVMLINEDVYGRITPDDLEKILAKYE